MKICDYSLELIRLEEQHLEILRQWRNSHDISQYMEYRNYITPEMQRSWFQKVNNLHNYYFIISYKDHLIGMIHLSDMNEERNIANCGLFISDSRFIDTHLPTTASLALLDFAFEHLRVDKVMAKVKSDNDKAIRYNLSLGFSFSHDDSEKEFRQIQLSKTDYFQSTAKLREAASKLSPGEMKIIFNDKLTLDNDLSDYLQKRRIAADSPLSA